jgi:hypothetical protein
MAPFGVTYLTSAPFTALAFTAALTTCLVAGDGEWVGQQKVFRTTTSVGATGVEITGSTARDISSSALTVKTPASITVSIVSDDVQLLAEWTGAQWNFFINDSVPGVA